jgi:hypothetical protein
MVSSLWLVPLGAASAILLAAAMQPVPAADDSIVCVNATRDWNEMANTASLEVTRQFLGSRVRPECPQLAARVRSRIASLEAAQNVERRPAARAPETRPVPVRRSRPVRSGGTPSVARASPPPRQTHVFFRRDSTSSSELSFSEPNWYQVLVRYPELEALFDQGGDDLCASCMVGASGSLEDCWVAGRRSNIPAIRDGTKLMMSMIRIARRDGSSAQGLPVGIPVHFGRLLPPPPGGYCSNPEANFHP